MFGYDQFQKMIDRNIIEVAPLAYMRGRTLEESFIILDEAQNTTREQMAKKIFLTRMGNHSRVVVNGDATGRRPARNRRSYNGEAERYSKTSAASAWSTSAMNVVRLIGERHIIGAYETYYHHDKQIGELP